MTYDEWVKLDRDARWAALHDENDNTLALVTGALCGRLARAFTAYDDRVFASTSDDGDVDEALLSDVSTDVVYAAREVRNWCGDPALYEYLSAAGLPDEVVEGIAKDAATVDLLEGAVRKVIE